MTCHESDSRKFVGLLAVAFGVCAILLMLALGISKVQNEMRMTEMYERQAVALERLAGWFVVIARHPHIVDLPDLVDCEGNWNMDQK